MTKTIRKSAKVTWKWAGRSIHGKVKDVFREKVTRQIKGKKISRNGTPENPAYLVVSDAGNLALKLRTELENTPSSSKKKNSTRKKPQIFS